MYQCVWCSDKLGPLSVYASLPNKAKNLIPLYTSSDLSTKLRIGVKFLQLARYCPEWPVHSQVRKVHSLNLLKRNCISEVVRIGGIIIFYLSKLWKAKFFMLCDVIFLVRLQEKLDIDRSWEWKGRYFNYHRHWWGVLWTLVNALCAVQWIDLLSTLRTETSRHVSQLSLKRTANLVPAELHFSLCNWTLPKEDTSLKRTTDTFFNSFGSKNLSKRPPDVYTTL